MLLLKQLAQFNFVFIKCHAVECPMGHKKYKNASSTIEKVPEDIAFLQQVFATNANIFATSENKQLTCCWHLK